MSQTNRLLVLPAALALAALAACAEDRPAKSPDNPPQASAAPAPAPMTTSESIPIEPPAATMNTLPTTPAPAEAQAPNAPTDVPIALSDEQILQVLMTADQAEIEQARLAQTKAKDPRVKKLAAMMIKDHTAAEGRGNMAAKRASLTPTPSPTSISLETDARGLTSTLKSEAGTDFDTGYVDAQVKEHETVLDLIDQKLLPSVQSSEVKALLAEVRPKIMMHLEHARALETAMKK